MQFSHCLQYHLGFAELLAVDAVGAEAQLQVRELRDLVRLDMWPQDSQLLSR